MVLAFGKKRFFLLLGIILLVIIASLVFLLKRPMKPWGRDQVSWISGESGNLQAKAVADRVLIEFTTDICKRRKNPVCGFEEYKGKFSDVARAVDYSVKQLDGKIKTNIKLLPKGEYEISDFGKTIESKFDISKPVRFIYFDANKYSFYKKAETFSYSWGVDPATKGLVFLIAEAPINSKWWYDSKILAGLDMVIEGTSLMGDKIIDPVKHEQLVSLWFGNSDRKNMIPEEGATLKIKNLN